MILCLGTTPAAQRVMVFPRLELDTVNRATAALDGAAGKAVNVAKVLNALGEKTVVAGFLGGERGAQLRARLAAKGLATVFLEVAAPTRQCVTVIDQTTGTVTELVEESRRLPGAAYRQLVELIGPRLRSCRALVLAGTITPGGPLDFYAKCARLANEAGALTVVDAQGALLKESLKARPGLVKPNRTELSATVERTLEDEADIVNAIQELEDRGAQRVVVSGGSRSTLAFSGRDGWRIHPPRIEPLNPIGSGDAATAGIVWRLLRGDDLGEACRWGAAAGAANALTLMPGELSHKEVERLVKQVTVERI